MTPLRPPVKCRQEFGQISASGGISNGVRVPLEHLSDTAWQTLTESQGRAHPDWVLAAVLDGFGISSQRLSLWSF